jgi:negative regulator of sigma E activity
MMDQERDSQLSAMFDGELQEAECELLARRLARDAQLKQKWTNYALIGAVIRDEPLQGHGRQPGVRASRLALGVASAVAAEGTSSGTGEAPAAPGAATAGAAVGGRRLSRWVKPLAGAGIAATVAALALLGLPSGPDASPVEPQDTMALAEIVIPASGAPVEEVILVAESARAPAAPTREPVLAASGEPESYVVPLPSDRRGMAAGAPSAQLANFVVAHSEFSAPFARRNVLSTLLAADSVDGDFSPPPPAVPPTEEPPAREQAAR